MSVTAGADVEKAGSGGITPLTSAAYRGRVAHVRLLLAHSASVNCVDRYGHDALYYTEQTLASLHNDEEDEPSGKEIDETVQIWRQEQKQNAQVCIALLRDKMPELSYPRS